MIGQGTAGLWFDFVLNRLGAARVIALDPKEYRSELAQQYGASNTINIQDTDPIEVIKKMNGGSLADIVVEPAGRESSINMIELAQADTGFFFNLGCPMSRSRSTTVESSQCLKHKSSSRGS